MTYVSFSMDFTGMHVVTTKGLGRDALDEVFAVAERCLPLAAKGATSEVLKGKVLGALFYEPSTRTRLSFEVAMQRLGGGVVSVVGVADSSLKKGESYGDTAKVVSQYVDVMAVRSAAAGVPAEMAASSEVPVLNAGDGSAEHPTQALLDVFTMQQERGKLDGLTVALVGDLRFGRTVHSLLYVLAEYKVKVLLVAPEPLRMPAELVEEARSKGLEVSEVQSLAEALAACDVCYMTRVQEERFDDRSKYEQLKDYYVLTRALVDQHNPEVTVMHPLPRRDEIALDVDELKGAAYFRQVQNGVALRMALLTLVLGKSAGL